MLSLCCLLGALHDDLMSRIFAKRIMEPAGNSIKEIRRNCEAEGLSSFLALVIPSTAKTHSI